MPQSPQNPFRRICAWLFAACGWRMHGALPDCERLVLIAAPHTSWWDGWWALLLKTALGADVAFMTKRELIRGPLGWMLRRLGAVPVERASTHGVVPQMVARFAARKPLWLGIAPEGTRRQVARWKTGFWQIAHAANVPILPVWFDYPSKTIGIGALFFPGADMDADIATLRDFYAPFQGKRRHDLNATAESTLPSGSVR